MGPNFTSRYFKVNICEEFSGFGCENQLTIGGIRESYLKRISQKSMLECLHG